MNLDIAIKTRSGCRSFKKEALSEIQKFMNKNK